MTKKFLLTLLSAAVLATPIRGASETQIYSAIRSGERAALERLLREGISPNHRDAQGNTLLMRAAIYGNADLLGYLLDKGADVNAANNAGATALMRAASDPAKVKLLVEKGAKINARSALGNTPLILAARAYPSAPAVRVLLSHGAEVNATNTFGASALMTAAAGGDLDSMRLLLESGADINAHSRGSEAAVIWGGGRSALMWASVRGDLPLLRELLKAGARVNEPEGFGTALIQAAWTDQTGAARLLLDHGADVNGRDLQSGYTALHWAASSENNSSALVDLLLKHGADANSEGGQQIDAFMGTGQTPMMLAKKRGQTDITRSLAAANAKQNHTREKPLARGNTDLPDGVNAEQLRLALNAAVPPLEHTAIESKRSFDAHSSKQRCVTCHQQYLPMIATAYARRAGATLDETAEEQLLAMVQEDNAAREELTLEATFHPEPGHAYGYALFSLGAQGRPADAQIDAIVHHLLVIQGKEGQWHNNLPRPPIQTSDVAPTALAIAALKTYEFPARQKEFETRIERARDWLRTVQAANTEELTYQIMGLAWAGEKNLENLTAKLLKQQRDDGGWGQLATLDTDAYATGQALFALHAAGLGTRSASYKKGLEYLLKTQLDDGTWHVARRAFPFQPTMRSGFPHSRDSWISATGTSWAAVAIALALDDKPALHAAAAE